MNPKCAKCGYDLSGLRSLERCPECGVENPSQTTPHSDAIILAALGITSAMLLWNLIRRLANAYPQDSLWQYQKEQLVIIAAATGTSLVLLVLARSWRYKIGLLYWWLRGILGVIIVLAALTVIASQAYTISF